VEEDRNVMTKREAVKELLQGYYDNPETRSVTELGLCLYNSNDGRCCAFAKACVDPSTLREYHWASRQLMDNGEEILKPKYRGLFNPKQWNKIQKVHDRNFDKLCLNDLESAIPETKGLFTPKQES
jgi:hypothetical protein